MDIQAFNEYLLSIPQEIRQRALPSMASAAQEYFIDSFERKSFAGNPWGPTKKPRGNGSTLVDTGKLKNSIQIAELEDTYAIITAGNQSVPYAMAHNEGVEETLNVKGYTRKTGAEVRPHTINQHIPARPFMGEADELNNILVAAIEEALNDI